LRQISVLKAPAGSVLSVGADCAKITVGVSNADSSKQKALFFILL
jgi:hypothetical protein